jgi:large subunit ribosomal protein L24
MARIKNKLRKLHVKKGDDVKIIAGNEKGKEGRVLAVFPKKERVLVEGINMRIHHDKPTQDNPQGGRIERESAVHVSNVMVIDPTNGEPTRTGRKYIEGDSNRPGKWARYSKKSGEIIDN